MWDQAQVLVDQAAGKAHWQVGEIEKNGSRLASMVDKNIVKHLIMVDNMTHLPLKALELSEHNDLKSKL